MCVQSPAVHGAPRRALLAGRAALQPDERAAEPQRRQDVLAAKRPAAAAATYAPTGRDQAPVCHQVWHGDKTTRALTDYRVKTFPKVWPHLSVMGGWQPSERAGQVRGQGQTDLAVEQHPIVPLICRRWGRSSRASGALKFHRLKADSKKQ